MRRVYLFVLVTAGAILLLGCGTQPAVNNAAANANARSSSTNANSTMPSSADTASAEAEIRKLMDAGQAALSKNDADAMDKIYADNYTLVNTDGSVQSRAERLASLRSGEAKYTSFSYSEPSIRVNPEGNGAVVIAKISMKGTFKGKSLDGDFRVMQVYSKTRDGWRQISAEATPITAGTSPSSANTSNGSSYMSNVNSTSNSNR
jgi:ketosteroid isomerase-like protein